MVIVGRGVCLIPHVGDDVEDHLAAAPTAARAAAITKVVAVIVPHVLNVRLPGVGYILRGTRSVELYVKVHEDGAQDPRDDRLFWRNRRLGRLRAPIGI